MAGAPKQPKTPLHRLRSVLGNDAVLYQGGRYCINPRLDYDYDTPAFEAQIAQARRTAAADEKATAYHRAAALYQGRFLPDLANQWIEIERERLHQSYLEAALFLGEFHLQRGSPAASLEICLRALNLDPWREEVGQIVMRAYAAQRNWAAVVQIHDRTGAACRQMYGQPLSPATERLFQSLIG